MAAKLLQLTISQVDGPVFSGLVQYAIVPGTEGEMTILADHVALISVLKKGMIEVMLENGTKETFKIESGTIEISKNSASILI